jgi:serine/threonine-protein kinase RsbW
MKKVLHISADLAQLESVGNTIAEMLNAYPAESYNMQLAIHECLTNIIIHAYGEQSGAIEIVLKLRWGKFSAEIHDNGRAFQPDDIQHPDLENGQIHGYGLFLMHQLMDSVAYESNGKGNSWRLAKRLSV